MSSPTLRMWYSSAKKEIRFVMITSNGEERSTANTSLTRYETRDRGRFVLQDKGDMFFDDIANTFNNPDSIVIEAATTLIDYEDLCQMVEHYNNSRAHKTVFRVTKWAELPNMLDTCEVVSRHGEQALVTLSNNIREFRDEKTNSTEVNDYIEDFVSDIERNLIADIRKRIDELDKANINLCFAGVYSSGKSTLINAILGHEVLPVSVRPETAKMFRIKSPDEGNVETIEFIFDGTLIVIEWDEASGCLHFKNERFDSDICREISKLIEEQKKASKHKQFFEVLSIINDQPVGNIIDIRYPIPLDSNTARFEIYDTPGTDNSSNSEHGDILLEALKEQNSSILVFVLTPTTTQGSGNQELLNYLTVLENSGRSMIDIDRSLFVFNQSDTLKRNGAEEREKLKRERLSISHRNNDNNNGVTLDLENKKTFFVSGQDALTVRRSREGDTLFADDIDDLKVIYCNRNRLDKAFFYKQDHVARSDYATERLIAESDSSYDDAESKGDIIRQIEISCGISALETEIRNYGEKYSAAVRANHILNSVSDAMAALQKRVDAFQAKNQDELNKTKDAALKLKKHLSEIIEGVYSDMIKDWHVEGNDSVFKSLSLDSQSIVSRIHEPMREYVNEIITESHVGEKTSEDKLAEINMRATQVFQGFLGYFNDQRIEMLENAKNDFKNNVVDKIKSEGGVSEDARNVICNIPETELPHPSIAEIAKIYNDSLTTKSNISKIPHALAAVPGTLARFLLSKVGICDAGKSFSEQIDELKYDFNKTEFVRKMAGILNGMVESLIPELKDIYGDTLKNVCDDISKKYNNNIETYSKALSAKLADANAMKNLAEKVDKTIHQLKDDEEELDQLLWKETR